MQHGSKLTCRSYARSSQVRSRPDLLTRARQKEESKDEPPVVSELHLGIKQIQTKEATHQLHGLQRSGSKKNCKVDLLRIDPRINGYKARCKSLNHLAMFVWEDLMISSNLV